MTVIFSDLYINKTTKIEILPSDFLRQENDFFVQGDTLITVFRKVGDSLVAERLHKDFNSELHAWYLSDDLNTQDLLESVIHRFNFSFICPPADLDLRPEGGSMVLVVYIDPKGIITVAQVGPIHLKQRKNKKLITLTHDHTFDNKKEVDRLLNSSIFKQYGKNENITDLINHIAVNEKLVKKGADKPGPKELYKKVPSRFIGHPSWCSHGGEFEDTIINTRAYVWSF